MSGYTRQSSADIIPTAVVRASPLNAEFNALRDAFEFSTAGVTGHKHDGSADQGSYVPLIADLDARNKVETDTTNNRIRFYVEVSSAAAEQFRVQDGVILPVVDNDIDLGSSSIEFKDLYIDGTAKVDTLTVDENATIAGTLNVTGLSTLASVDINGGAIDGAVIGAASAQAITGTLITATTGFSGTLTGNVTGNITGNITGDVTGNVTGNLTGNVTASSGSSTFNNVTINGTLDMSSGTAGTITGLSAPSNATDAATKTYVDTADALKLNLSGGTMSGAIAMGSNKITGLGTPTDTADAATKGYVDTQVSNLIDSAPGALDTLNELAAALGDDANFSTTVTNSLATKLNLSGGTMTGNITMGSNAVTSTATPATNDTLTRKGYVDTQDALKLNLSGGTMSGAIAMGTNKITGMGDPTANQDAATKKYVDDADALKLNLSGGTMTGNIVMGANKVTSTATPTTDDDLTRKAYVDSILGSATAAAASAAAAAVSETNAAGSASSALSSANSAAASFDSFDDRYLGAKASPPSVDNDGNALLTGALYWNTGNNSLYIWTGSAWNAAAFNLSDPTFNTVTTGQVDITGTGDLRLQDTTGGQYVALQAPGTVSTSYTLTLPAADGTNGQVLTTNGSGILSFGAAGGTTTFTASGAITAGDPVSVNSNGTVSKVSQPAAVPTLSAQSDQSDVLGTPIYVSIGSDKLISFYESVANDDLRAVVVDVSTSTPSYGTAVVVLTPTVADGGILMDAKYDSTSGNTFLLYADTNGANYDFYVRALTVSGTTITQGTAVNVDTATAASASQNATICVDSPDASFLYVCWDGTAKVCSFSGTTITVQNTYTAPDTNMRRLRSDINQLSNPKIGLFYADADNSNYLTMTSVAITATTAGSFASPGVLNSESYADGGFAVTRYGNDTGYVVFSASSNAILIGLADADGYYFFTISTSDATYSKTATWRAIYSSTNTQYLLSYSVYDTSASPNYPAYFRYFPSGLFGAGARTLIQRQPNTGAVMFSWDNANRRGLVYSEASGTVDTFRLTNDLPPSTNLQFIGIAAANISNAAAGPITTVGGTNSSVTGLTAGTSYFVSTTGTLTTTNTGVKAGMATSATTLLVNTAMNGDEMNAYIGSL